MDTPGIGGSEEVTWKLDDYLPNAASFIFVINIGDSGGIKSGRVIIRITIKFKMHLSVV